SHSTTRGGQLVFYPAVPGAPQPELQLRLPVGGTGLRSPPAGRWQRPSVEDGDAVVEATDAVAGQPLGTTPLMVRVRKNAVTLTAAERDRLCAAFARLNNRGMGRFSDFRNVHTEAGSPEAHGRAGFLPWHRAFLLGLEREPQRSH